ncbi:MAG TPA: penicillin acylase family protein [Terriglobales bacterium]|nr:penicillin acylase family protein [Terriglobales bacterium]
MTTWAATPTLPVPPRTRVPLFFRILLAVLLLLLGAAAYLYLTARTALPVIDGTLIVHGLTGPVRVIRDGHGVPSIEAHTLEDLFFAQGYVTAQDRLWQMDLMRRYAGGDMAELLGPALLTHDREQRILGLRDTARRAVVSASPRDRSHFEAYARGVNAFRESHLDRLPIEFRILRYQPSPWQVEDSILLGARLVQELNYGTFWHALAREKIMARLGPERAADLYVNTSWRDRPPSSETLRIDGQQPPGDEDDQDDDDEDMDSGADNNIARTVLFPAPLMASDRPNDPALVPGSNNWAVSGEHTVTGRPMLSNDMHLSHQMPNLWYEAHLHCGDYDVVGVTLPGLPFVIVGHNQRIAWGFTNVGPTVEDLYIESFNDQGAYQTPNGWRPAEHRREVIHVKGQPDVVLEVVLTRHGPIITDLIPGETRKLALRWTLYDSLHDPFFDVDSAQNWDEFRRALAAWDSPSQNAMYADVDGHIGYQATGHIPIRKTGDGSLPVSGADDAHEWTGYIPFDKLLRVFDPPSGILATANARITPDHYPYSVSTEWGAPWRTERVYRVLESGRKFSTADMLSLQTDVYSAFDRLCAERFVYALDHVQKLSLRAQQAREFLRDWDGRLAVDSAAATIENRAQHELVRMLLEPGLGPAPEGTSGDRPSLTESLSWRSYRWFMSSVWLENVLEKQPKRWLPDNYASYNELLAAAVEAAVNNPAAPRELAQWRWGKFAPVDIEHPVLARLPLVGRWTAPGLHDQPGGSYTVKQVGRSFGPSERFTADLSNLDQSTLNTVTGQAGNFLSPYYMDQWQAWYEGTTFALPFSPQAVEKAKAHELTLKPGN